MMTPEQCDKLVKKIDDTMAALIAEHHHLDPQTDIDNMTRLYDPISPGPSPVADVDNTQKLQKLSEQCWKLIRSDPPSNSGFTVNFDRDEAIAFMNQAMSMVDEEFPDIEGDVEPDDETKEKLRQLAKDTAAEIHNLVKGFKTKEKMQIATEESFGEDPIPVAVRTSVVSPSGISMGKVIDLTLEGKLFLQWLRHAFSEQYVASFLRYADETWTSDDPIDFLSYNLDWWATEFIVGKWRNVNNEWRVFLADNESVKTQSLIDSILFLRWLEVTYNEETVSQFLENSRPEWRESTKWLIPRAGMKHWASTPGVDPDEWNAIAMKWEKHCNEE